MSKGQDRGAELVIVGIGIQLGRHVSERSLSEIRRADHVFVLADPFALHWLLSLRPDAVSLHACYAEGKDRRHSYDEMVAMLLEPLAAGGRVCGVFYGHPGVFADVPRKAIEAARALGCHARMEPGISAAACLYADLGLDPGRQGLQAMEATQFLATDRRVDPTMLVVLWQVALSGDLACRTFEPSPERLGLLVDKLRRCYPDDPEVIVYEAARLPIEPFRADRFSLTRLPEIALEEHSTLVIPPMLAAPPDRAMIAALERLD